jgi:glycosyltransferase involved in cell wall biosynthesis
MGGAERVADALADALPNSTLHTTLAAPAKLIPSLQARHLQTTWMQRLPNPGKYYRHYFMLYPFAIEWVDLTAYDLIVSSCFGYAKGVRRRKGAVHVCYCHTPMRWVWRCDDYMARERFGRFSTVVTRGLLGLLRRWDLHAAKRPDYFIASSEAVASRLRACYGRDAVIIPPPIDVGRFHPAEAISDAYLVLSRMTAYKRIDLAIQACNMLRRPLILIGDGPDRRRLQQIAGPTIEFRGRLTDGEVNHALACCRALLFPGEEDFGLAPLEANASGRPVIAWRGGGAVETVRENETGLFFDQPTAASLAEAIQQFERQVWSVPVMRAHATCYDRSVFVARIRAFVRSVAPSVPLAAAVDAADASIPVVRLRSQVS